MSSVTVSGVTSEDEALTEGAAAGTSVVDRAWLGRSAADGPVADQTTTAGSAPEAAARQARIDALEGQLAQVCGQVNVLMGRIVELTAEAQELGLPGECAMSSTATWVAWKTGTAAGSARRIATLADRQDDLPETIGALKRGLLSVDQAGAVAARAPGTPEADDHYCRMAQVMTVRQLSTALRAAVPPTEPEPDRATDSDRGRVLTFHTGDDGRFRARIEAPAADGASFETGLRAHLDALHNERRRAAEEGDSERRLPTWFDALERMVDRSLEREAADRPHHRRTKVIVHVDADTKLATLHLGPALTAAERTLLTCDASVETVLERFGTPVSVGREHRIVPDTTRTLVERRDRHCVIPGCGGRGRLQAHHIVHWEDGGPTDTWNLVCVCPFHHREIHAGRLEVSGDADDPAGLTVDDARGDPVTGASLARPPDGLPDPPRTPYRHPDGGRMDWRRYAGPQPRRPRID